MTGSISNTISVIVPVGARRSSVAGLFAEYTSGMKAIGRPYEMIFVLDGPQPEWEQALGQLAASGEPVTVVALSRYFGEATALMIGLEHAVGEIIMTLPSYHQVKGASFPALIAALETADVAVGCRQPHASRWHQTIRRRAFHGLLKNVTSMSFNDLGCNVRAMRRKVLEEIQLYGDQDRFLPVLATRQGFKVREIEVTQSPDDHNRVPYTPRIYTRGFLDIFSVFFLVRFTKRPLRFFGMVGVGTFVLGLAQLAWLAGDRLFFDTPLADRPALLLASLLIVLGVQVFALGLLGELIIFTHGGGRKDYQVDRVVQYPPVKRAVSARDSDVVRVTSDDRQDKGSRS